MTSDASSTSAFDEVERHAWAHNGGDEFVGSGYVKIAIVRFRNSDRLPELCFFYKEKRISRARAKELVESWSDYSRHLRQRHGR